MHVRTTAVDLAHWLELNGGLWTVDGEPTLARALPAPASASPLAEAVRARGGQLVLLLPEGCTLRDGMRVDVRDLDRAAHLVDGHRVFQLAWVDADGATRDSWLLAEHDVLAQSGDGEVTAARIVAGWNGAWPAPNIKR